MKTIFATLLIASVLLIACGDNKEEKAKEYAEAIKKEMTALNHQYDSLLISRDTARLDKFYAAEYSYTTPEGQLRNKTQQLTNVASGGLKMEYGKSDEMQVVVYDSTAILTGRFIGKGTFMQNFVDVKSRYTSVWTKKDGQWMLVREQSTYIKE